MNSKDDTALLDKKTKRTVKTPSQLEALENFYDEHNYPSEIMKLQLAEKIGLTESQVSSWFCYRRLKDKRIQDDIIYEYGKQDRSTVVVQDSCGSTKQAKSKAQDPIEGQSKTIIRLRIPVEAPSKQKISTKQAENTSSESSSSPHNSILKVDHAHMTVSNSSTQNVVNFVNAGKAVTGPSGYLKVKARHPDVMAVLKKLGSHYRHNGPPIGIVFDPLPPLAFEPLTQLPENTLDSSKTHSAEQVAGLSPVAQGIYQECTSKPNQIEEDNLLHSENPSRVRKIRIPNAGSGCTPNISFSNTILDGKSSKMIHKSVQSESFFSQKHKQELSLSGHRSMRSTGGSLTVAPAGHHQLQPYIGGVDQQHEEPWPKNSGGRIPKVEQRDSFKVRKCENDAPADKGLSHKEAKVGSFYGVKGEINDDIVTAQPKLPRKNKKHMVKDEYQHKRKV